MAHKPVLVRLLAWVGILLELVAGFFWYVTPKTAAYGPGLFGCMVTAFAGVCLLGLWAIISAVLWLLRRSAQEAMSPLAGGSPRPPARGPTVTSPLNLRSGGPMPARPADNCSVCAKNPAAFVCMVHFCSICQECMASHDSPLCWYVTYAAFMAERERVRQARQA